MLSRREAVSQNGERYDHMHTNALTLKTTAFWTLIFEIVMSALLPHSDSIAT